MENPIQGEVDKRGTVCLRDFSVCVRPGFCHLMEARNKERNAFRS